MVARLSVKVGDLVIWTHPAAESFGVVVEAGYSDFWRNHAVFVMLLDGKSHGEYPVNHEWLELVSESR